MFDAITDLIQRSLRLLGLRSINSQFFFSYLLIFCCAALTAAVLFLSVRDATQLDMAGAQRMLSQKMAKESILVAQKVLPMSQLEQTVQRFESSHRLLLKGDTAQNIKPLKLASARQQLEVVDREWEQYRQRVMAVAAGGTTEAELRGLAGDSEQILKDMNEVVGLMSADANSTAASQRWLAMCSTLIILLLVVLGRLAGMNWLMHRIGALRHRLELVGSGDFSQPLEARFDDDEIGRITHAYNQLLTQVGEMIRAVRESAQAADESCARMASMASVNSSNVREQQAEIDQVATAMNQMLATSHEVARSTVEAASAADTAERETSSGHAVMQVSVDAIRDLSRHVEGLSEVMQQLLADSEEDLPQAVTDIYRFWHIKRSAGTQRRNGPKVGRNDPCPCGSGKKFKQCCGSPEKLN